jgi:hypothetical protein
MDIVFMDSENEYEYEYDIFELEPKTRQEIKSKGKIYGRYKNIYNKAFIRRMEEKNKLYTNKKFK